MGWLLVIALVTASCGSDSLPTPASTPATRPTAVPTSTFTPRPTPIPTNTPVPTPTPTPRPSPTPYPLVTGTISETVVSGSLALTVNEVIVPKTDAKSGPPAGYRFIVVDLTMHNMGNQAVPITVAREMILKDSTDQIYKASARATAAVSGTMPDITLAPGEKIKAQVGFEVPVKAEKLVFTFAADRFSGGKIFIALP
ncbi:MAG: DUF4352 domain-containing protein [Anaerolineae bacterium]|nr:DUF4352 domain-containing protein [Anaerolineae bacterium]